MIAFALYYTREVANPKYLLLIFAACELKQRETVKVGNKPFENRLPLV